MARRGEPAPDGLVTLPQVAEVLRLSPRSVQRRAKAIGLMPVERLGGIDYYDRAGIERLRAAPVPPEETQDRTILLLVETLRKAYEDTIIAKDLALDAVEHRAKQAELERDRLRIALGERGEVPPNVVLVPFGDREVQTLHGVMNFVNDLGDLLSNRSIVLTDDGYERSMRIRDQIAWIIALIEATERGEDWPVPFPD